MKTAHRTTPAQHYNLCVHWKEKEAMSNRAQTIIYTYYTQNHPTCQAPTWVDFYGSVPV